MRISYKRPSPLAPAVVTRHREWARAHERAEYEHLWAQDPFPAPRGWARMGDPPGSLGR